MQRFKRSFIVTCSIMILIYGWLSGGGTSLAKDVVESRQSYSFQVAKEISDVYSSFLDSSLN